MQNLMSLFFFKKNLREILSMVRGQSLDRPKLMHASQELVELSAAIQESFLQTKNKMNILSLQHTDKIEAYETLLKNIPIGVLMVLPNQKIHQLYSPYVEELFETKQVKGEDLHQFLFSKSSLSPKILRQNIVALMSVLGQDEEQYARLSDSFIKDYTRTFSSGITRHFNLDWFPLLDPFGVVEKVLILVRDGGPVFLLREELKRHQEEQHLVQEMLASHLSLEKMEEVLIDWEKEIDLQRDKLTLNEIKEELTLIHDRRILAGSYHWSSLERLFFALESLLYSYLSGERNFSLLEVRQLQEQLERSIREMLRVKHKWQEIFQQLKDKDPANYSTKRREDFFQWMDSFALELDKTKRQELISKIHEVMSPLLSDLAQQCLQKKLRALNIHPLALELHFFGDPLILKAENISPLTQVLDALIENSLQFGIEKIHLRKVLGKSEVGQIEIEGAQLKKSYRLIYRDDGRGVPIQQLRQMAIQKKLWHVDQVIRDEDLLPFLWIPGMTSLQLDWPHNLERGMGMDLIKRTIEGMGGSVNIRPSLTPRKEEEYLPFEILLEFSL